MLWLEDSSILYQIGQLRYFMPSSQMTWQQQTNALVRFVVYLSFILYLYYGNVMVLLLPPIFIMLIQLYLYREGKLEQQIKQFFGSELKENFILRSDDYLEQADQFSQRELGVVMGQENHILDEENNPTMADARELGRESRRPTVNPLASQRQKNQQVDSQAEHRQRQVLAEVQQTTKPKYQERSKNIFCKKSTEANPFGNSLPWQSHEQDVFPVCPNEYTKDSNFYRNLFNDVNDVWDRNNGQLIFNSNPSTTRINDREAFMQFLFNTPYTEY